MQDHEAVLLCTGLTEGEKEEKARAKEALNEDGESDDDGDTRKAATYGNKKTEVSLSRTSCCMHLC